MSPLAIALLGVGILIIVTRGPLVFAPRQTLDFYTRLIARDDFVRGLGAFMVLLGLVAFALARSETRAVGTLTTFGVFFSLAAGWLIGWPAGYRSLADAVLDTMRDSVDGAITRFIGAAAVVFALAIIYAAVFVIA